MTVIAGRRGTGGGGGSASILGTPDNLFGATSGDARGTSVSPAGSKAIAESTRDDYFTSNPSQLTQYGDPRFYLVLLYTDSGQIVAQPQVLINNVWRDTTAIRPIRGQDGAGTDFSTVTPLHIPAIGVDGFPFDSGLMVDQVADDLVTPGSIRTNNGSYKFRNGSSISSAGATVAFRNNTGVVGTAAGQSVGEARCNYFKWTETTEGSSNFNTKSDQTIITPFQIAAQATGDFITVDFEIIPAEEGRLRVELFKGSNDSGESIYDQSKTFESGDVDTVQRFSLGNPYILSTGEPVFIRMSGISLKGGSANASDLLPEGTVTPFYKSITYPYVLTDLAEVADLTKDAVPSVHDMNLTGVPSFFDQTETIVGDHSVSFGVTNYTHIQNLSLRVSSGAVSSDLSLTVPTSDGRSTQSFNINQTLFDQFAQETTISFRIVGQTTDNVQITSNTVTVTRGTRLPAFYGFSSDVDVAAGSLSQVRVGTGSRNFQVTGSLSDGQFLVILVPTTEDVSKIYANDFPNIDIRSTFNRTPSFRNISGQDYNRYTLENQSGETLSINYTVEV